MALLRLREVSLAFGVAPLLDKVDFSIERGERICVVGRNGAGKSTMMKVIADEIQADSGEIVRQQNLKVTRMTQEVPEGTQGSVYDIVAGGLGDVGELLRRYHKASQALAYSADDKALKELEHAQHALEAVDGWQLNQRVEATLSRLSLDADLEFAEQSGGMKRRVLLARALVQEPDLLLLDEPTNHLDIDAIQWMEEFLLSWGGTLLFITHDRAFLRRLATRIIEVDRGRLSDWPGDYDNYLRRKQEALEAEAAENARFDKKLAQEEVWIRQGIKARRTRNEGRVRALKALREERKQRRERQGNVKMATQIGERSGKVVAEVENLKFEWEGKPIVDGFSSVIERGDRIGIIGPNGCGKSTLLQLLLGQIKPQSGKVKQGTNLQIAYFDQHRAQLDEDQSVLDNVAEGRERIEINGQPKHVMSYLQDFLFSPERVRSPVSSLSGGERNRLLLARLFTKPANLLVLDEPTNDLDAETLDLLEELLLEYSGTLLLVSHDRAFINNVVTSTIVFDTDGVVREYVGGYEDWLRQRPSLDSKAAGEKPAAPVEEKPKAAAKAKKLSYKDQRELDTLPERIESLETEQEALHAQISNPAFYQGAADEISNVQNRLQVVEQELEQAYARWDELEG